MHGCFLLSPAGPWSFLPAYLLPHHRQDSPTQSGPTVALPRSAAACPPPTGCWTWAPPSGGWSGTCSFLSYERGPRAAVGKAGLGVSLSPMWGRSRPPPPPCSRLPRGPRRGPTHAKPPVPLRCSSDAAPTPRDTPLATPHPGTTATRSALPAPGAPRRRLEHPGRRFTTGPWRLSCSFQVRGAVGGRSPKRVRRCPGHCTAVQGRVPL